MKCPVCNCKKLSVTGGGSKDTYVTRYRKCTECSESYTTTEIFGGIRDVRGIREESMTMMRFHIDRLDTILKKIGH